MSKPITIQEQGRQLILSIDGKEFIIDSDHGIPNCPGAYSRIRDLYYVAKASFEACLRNECV